MIVGYVGPQGSGKTLWMTHDLITAMRRGVPVACNYDVWDPVTDQRAVRLDMSRGLDAVFDFVEEQDGRQVVVGADEVGTLMPARYWDKVTTLRLMHRINTVRKRRLHLRWTAQYFDQLDKHLRVQTTYAYECSIVLRHPWRVDPDGDPDPETGKLPHVPLLLRADAYRPRHVESAQPGDVRRKQRVRRRWMRFDADVLGRAFDTREVPVAVEEASDEPASAA